MDLTSIRYGSEIHDLIPAFSLHWLVALGTELTSLWLSIPLIAIIATFQFQGFESIKSQSPVIEMTRISKKFKAHLFTMIFTGLIFTGESILHHKVQLVMLVVNDVANTQRFWRWLKKYLISNASQMHMLSCVNVSFDDLWSHLKHPLVTLSYPNPQPLQDVEWKARPFLIPIWCVDRKSRQYWSFSSIQKLRRSLFSPTSSWLLL